MFHVKQLNPKSRKGTDTMNEVINRELARIKYDATKKAIAKVEKATFARINQISQVVDSSEGMNILNQSVGLTFRRQYDLRCILRGKLDVLWKIMAECHEAHAEAHQELIRETNNL